MTWNGLSQYSFLFGARHKNKKVMPVVQPDFCFGRGTTPLPSPFLPFLVSSLPPLSLSLPSLPSHYLPLPWALPNTP